MRATLIEGPRKVRTVEVDRPAPGSGEVLVRMSGSGICGSEMPVFEGREWMGYPLEPGAPGHEGWGVVEALGEGVAGVETGERVAAISFHAHAEYDVASADALAAVPSALGDRPFPGEALGCAANIFDRSGIEAGNRVAIVGVGFIGAVLTSLCNYAGAHVTAISRRPFALATARRMGAAETLPIDDAVPASEDDALFDRVIECTGLQGPLDLAGALTRTRGRLVIAGFHQDGMRSVNMQLWNWRGIDVVNAHERDSAAYVRGVQTAAAAISTGRLDPSPLYTHLFPADQAEKAYRTASERPDGFIKAVLVW